MLTEKCLKLGVTIRSALSWEYLEFLKLRGSAFRVYFEHNGLLNDDSAYQGIFRVKSYLTRQKIKSQDKSFYRIYFYLFPFVFYLEIIAISLRRPLTPS